MRKKYPIGRVVFSEKEEYDAICNMARRKGLNFSSMARVLLLREYNAEARSGTLAQRPSEVMA